MWVILKKELKDIFRQGVVKIAGLSLILLLGISLLVSYAYYGAVNQQIADATEEAREHWENQGQKRPHSAAHFGMYLFKPSSALAFWDTGVDRYTGITVYTEAHKRNTAQFRTIEDSPMLARWGELTPSFVLMVLLPLLIIYIGFRLVSAEREGGTFLLVKSQGLPMFRWLLAKYTALWVVVLMLLVPAFVVTVFLLPGEKVTSPWAPLLLLLSYCLYAAVFVHASIGLSALVPRSSAVLLSLIGFWVAATWVIPKVSHLHSDTAIPLPTVEEFVAGITKTVDEKGIRAHSEEGRAAAEVAKLVSLYQVSDVQQLPVSLRGVMLDISEQVNGQIADEHYQELYSLYEQQMRIHQNWALLSPYMLIRQLSMGICQTDIYSHMHFVEATEEYRRAFISLLNKEIVKYGEAGIANPTYEADNELWKQIPDFTYQLPGPETNWPLHRRELWSLAGWSLLSGLLLIAGGRKLSAQG